MNTQIIDTFLALKEQKPLVHNITNFVVMNNTANALLAIGASPVMAHAKEELKEMLAISSSLVVNIGTVDKRWLKSMKKASQIAHKKCIPWVLDPVGAGATTYRTQTALELIEQNQPNIIRANASEIMAMVNSEAKTKGVDSLCDTKSALDYAQSLASRYQNTIVISGETDFIISEGKQTQIQNGSALMSKVTGMGCTASAITGAALAICKDSHLAAVTAMSIMGIAGEIAEKTATGPGSFQVAFLDALYQLDAKNLKNQLRIFNE